MILSFHLFCWPAQKGCNGCTRSTLRNNRMDEPSIKNKTDSFGSLEKNGTKRFSYIFIYEVPHLLLIAEIKTVFFSLRCSLPEIFRHISVAKKTFELQVKKSQALNASSTLAHRSKSLRNTKPQQALCAASILFLQRQIKYKL